MKLLPLLFLSASAERLDRKQSKPVIVLGTDAQVHFDIVDEILGEMADLFSDLDPVGKKDFALNAKGMEKWNGKIKKAFNDRWEKCVPEYYESDEFT